MDNKEDDDDDDDDDDPGADRLGLVLLRTGELLEVVEEEEGWNDDCLIEKGEEEAAAAECEEKADVVAEVREPEGRDARDGDDDVVPEECLGEMCDKWATLMFASALMLTTSLP